MKQVGMVGSKSTQTRIACLADKMHPYILFSSDRVSVKMCVGMHLVSSSRLFLFVYFFILPSLLASSTYLVAFYTCLCYFFPRAELQQDYQAIV